MNRPTTQLVSLLERKHKLLLDLIDRQEALKAFLVRPRWARYFEMTKPQEDILLQLRRLAQDQNVLVSQIAADLGFSDTPSVVQLAERMDDPARGRILDITISIKQAVAELKGLSQLGHVLVQAQWRFYQECAQAAPQQPAAHNGMYTPQGYSPTGMPISGGFSQQV